MLIGHMTFSRAMACAGDQARETLRSCKKTQGESGLVRILAVTVEKIQKKFIFKIYLRLCCVRRIKVSL
jgi:hypothetical protein